jgi:serine phosphatase RsbU (regulator of sigma subunit)
MRNILILLSGALLLSSTLFGKTPQMSENDSLLKVLEGNIPDSTRAKTLNRLGLVWMHTDPAKGYAYAHEAEQIAIKLGRKKTMALSWYIMGNCLDNLQDFQGALNFFYKALPIQEDAKNKEQLIRLYNQIGIIYAYRKDYQNALRYFNKFADVAEQMNDPEIMGNCYNNIGVIYRNLKKNDIAADFIYRALKIFQETGNKRGISSCYSNLGNLYEDDHAYDEALVYHKKSIALMQELKENFGITTGYVNLGEIHKQIGNLDSSMLYFDSALVLAEKDNDRLHMRDAHEGLHKVYAKKGDYKKAYETYGEFIRLRDTLFNADNAKQSADLEARNEMIKKEKELDLVLKDSKIQELENNRNKVLLVLLAVVLISIVVFAILINNRYKAKRDANLTLERQNFEIHHQKKEITDSINYAKRIQESILPPEKLIQTYLPDSFVLYHPKDIVSGDFYWVDKKGNYVFFAAVDCTGHGVPGAMMSVLGFNLIQQAINDKELVKPSDILRHLDHGVNMTLRQTTEASVKDGMDLALCTLDMERMEVQFAGAYNNLWIIRKNGNTVEEIKADKKIIGSNLDNVADDFMNHVIKVEKGDMLYVYSDGYADQFGGPHEKKFKYKPLKELLISIKDRSMKEQKQILSQTIKDWQGELEQVDDILIIGVRV